MNPPTFFAEVLQTAQVSREVLRHRAERPRRRHLLSDTPDSRPPRVIPQRAQDQAGELGLQADHRRLVPGVGELIGAISWLDEHLKGSFHT